MHTQQDSSSHHQKPLISFIIPCHNLPTKLVCDCLDSIISLSLNKVDRQIIVVDDGSDTPLIDQLSNYADHIVYIRKANGGVSSARNMGLLLATGMYIQFVDGDDWLERTPYEHVVDIVRFSQPEMVMFDFHQGDVDSTCDYLDEALMTGRDLMRNSNIHGAVWGYLFSRSILGTLQFSPDIAYGEDEEFTPQLLLRAERVIRTSAKAYYYRVRPSSAINTPTAVLKRLDDNLTVIERLSVLADTLPVEEHAALTRRIDQLTMDHIYNIILLTHDEQLLYDRLKRLRQLGRYPLPARNYTRKYVMFRKLANHQLGLKMLFRAIPMIKKEK